MATMTARRKRGHKSRADRTKSRAPAKARPKRKVIEAEQRVWELLRGARLSKLLLAEKRRRGVPSSQMVFVGVHNLAQYNWCAMYSVLKSRAVEPEFFLAHLQDRISAALHLARPAQVEKPEDLLGIGQDIQWTELPLNKPGPRGGSPPMHSFESDDVDPFFDEKTPPKDQLARGQWAEWRYAKRLPSIRWSFECGAYVLVGIPDGIGKDFVYEFKSTKSDYLLNFQRPVARAQGDLYGYFFGKTRKLIQIHVMEGNRIENIDEDVDRAKAENLLSKFEQLDHGGDAYRPKSWKCCKCEHRADCPWLADPNSELR